SAHHGGKGTDIGVPSGATTAHCGIGTCSRTEVTRVEQRLRAYKYALDPNPAQRALLEQCAGAARHAYNLLIAENRERGDRYRLLRDHLTTRGLNAVEIKAALREHEQQHPDESLRPLGYQAYATQH